MDTRFKAGFRTEGKLVRNPDFAEEVLAGYDSEMIRLTHHRVLAGKLSSSFPELSFLFDELADEEEEDTFWLEGFLGSLGEKIQFSDRQVLETQTNFRDETSLLEETFREMQKGVQDWEDIMGKTTDRVLRAFLADFLSSKHSQLELLRCVIYNDSNSCSKI